ncbi:hypothetical protein F4557_003101 [Actinomadura catellatispora]|uniref:Uncharacterized protein n=1 Tax=Actinomadura livida TaxID=79909 RepID=A0A7W7MXH1_9ACTN|nr:hypothetical protein [Actinomadura catellatispora]
MPPVHVPPSASRIGTATADGLGGPDGGMANLLRRHPRGHMHLAPTWPERRDNSALRPLSGRSAPVRTDACSHVDGRPPSGGRRRPTRVLPGRTRRRGTRTLPGTRRGLGCPWWRRSPTDPSRLRGGLEPLVGRKPGWDRDTARQRQSSPPAAASGTTTPGSGSRSIRSLTATASLLRRKSLGFPFLALRQHAEQAVSGSTAHRRPTTRSSRGQCGCTRRMGCAVDDVRQHQEQLRRIPRRTTT